jgi:hypothetical protein
MDFIMMFLSLKWSGNILGLSHLIWRLGEENDFSGAEQARVALADSLSG